MRSSRFVAAPVVLVLAGLLGPTAPAPALAAPPGVPVIEWGTCGEDAPARLQCATVEVPLDYVDPETEALLELDLLRVPATGEPSERLGSLFVNPGGPGGSSTGFAAWFGRLVPDDISERYDI